MWRKVGKWNEKIPLVIPTRKKLILLLGGTDISSVQDITKNFIRLEQGKGGGYTLCDFCDYDIFHNVYRVYTANNTYDIVACSFCGFATIEATHKNKTTEGEK